MLVFKDGSVVNNIPGTDPPELFTLCPYKEMSGFGYSQIKLFLVPLFEEKINDLKSLLEDTDSESSSSDEEMPVICYILKQWNSRNPCLIFAEMLALLNNIFSLMAYLLNQQCLWPIRISNWLRR